MKVYKGQCPHSKKICDSALSTEPCSPLGGDKLCSRQEAAPAQGTKSKVTCEDASVNSELGRLG